MEFEILSIETIVRCPQCQEEFKTKPPFRDTTCPSCGESGFIHGKGFKKPGEHPHYNRQPRVIQEINITKLEGPGSDRGYKVAIWDNYGNVIPGLQGGSINHSLVHALLTAHEIHAKEYEDMKSICAWHLLHVDDFYDKHPLLESKRK